MIVLDAGHFYVIEALDGGESQTLRFMKRTGPNYPGNEDSNEGPITQEVLRALIDRCKYMNNQGSCAETDIIISSLRAALMMFEVRAARCRGTSIDLASIDGIEDIPTCPTCGHIQCDQTRHSRLHWSEEKREMSEIVLESYEREALVQALQDPPQPSEKARQAAELYKAQQESWVRGNMELEKEERAERMTRRKL